MARIHSVVPLSLLAFAIVLARPLPVVAEDVPRLEIGYSDLESEGRTSNDSRAPRRECTPRYMAGPGVGIPLGLGTAALGSAFVFVSSVPNETSLPDGRAAGIAGAVMIPVGVAAFIYSSIKLSKNRRTRLRVCPPRPGRMW
jgi:hypothetical protein